jgi:hypothetical protein
MNPSDKDPGIFMGNLKANQLVMINAKTNMIKQSSGITHSKDNHSSSKLVQDHKNSNLIIFYQNIQGIRNKVGDFLISLSANEPQIICLSEHHLRTEEIDKLNLYQYIIGTSFCRQHYSSMSVNSILHIHHDDIYHCYNNPSVYMICIFIQTKLFTKNVFPKIKEFIHIIN